MKADCQLLVSQKLSEDKQAIAMRLAICCVDSPLRIPPEVEECLRPLVVTDVATYCIGAGIRDTG